MSSMPINGVNTRVGGWDGAPAISSIVEFWADVNQADVQEETTQDRTIINKYINTETCLLYTSPSPRDRTRSRMPSSA